MRNAHPLPPLVGEGALSPESLSAPATVGTRKEVKLTGSS